MDFCVDAKELQLTQHTASSHINYSDGYIKTCSFVFTDSVRVIVCFHLKPAHTRAICLAKCHSCHFTQHIAPVCV